MREFLHTAAEALALSALVIFIALIAAPTLPFAHSRPGLAARAERVEPPARVPPQLAGRDEIAQLIERAP